MPNILSLDRISISISGSRIWKYVVRTTVATPHAIDTAEIQMRSLIYLYNRVAK